MSKCFCDLGGFIKKSGLTRPIDLDNLPTGVSYKMASDNKRALLITQAVVPVVNLDPCIYQLNKVDDLDYIKNTYNRGLAFISGGKVLVIKQGDHLYYQDPRFNQDLLGFYNLQEGALVEVVFYTTPTKPTREKIEKVCKIDTLRALMNEF